MAITVNFESNIEEILPLLETAKQEALFEIGSAVHGDAVENSPARTGNLRRSFMFEIEDDSVTIGVPLGALERDYAKYVELGTSKQPARHMLRNAVESNKGNIRGIVEEKFKNA